MATKAKGATASFPALLIESNVIHDNGVGGGSGINCDGVQKSLIRNNLLYNNHSSGISLYRGDGAAGSIENRIINNTIVQPTKSRWAINIKYQSTNNHIVNNILINKGSRGSINVSADSMPGLVSDYNIVDDRLSLDDGERIMSLRTWNSATGLDGHSQFSKPKFLFLDEAADDFHLRSGSPAIDSADPAVSPQTDIEGTIRPLGPRPDIGAYEAKEGMASEKGSAAFSLPPLLMTASILLPAAYRVFRTSGVLGPRA